MLMGAAKQVENLKTNYDLIKAIELLPRKDWEGIPGVTVTQSQTLEALAKCLFHGQDIYDPRNLVFPSLEKIARLLRVSQNTAKSRMKSLREAGWIFKRERELEDKNGETKQTSNQYFFSRAIFSVAEAMREEDQLLVNELVKKAKSTLHKNSLQNRQSGELNGGLSVAAREVKAVINELLLVNVNQNPGQVANLVLLLQEKQRIFEQQRVQVKNGTPGVLKKLPVGSRNRVPRGLKNETLNTPIKCSQEISKLNKTPTGTKCHEEELNRTINSFETGTGIKVTPKAKSKLERNRSENGLSIEQVEKNVTMIIESPALRVTTTSIARAGHQASVLAFAERQELAKFKRAAQAGELNKSLGNKFKSEYDAQKTLLPDVVESRAQQLDCYQQDPVEQGQQYLASLSDQEYVARSFRYEGEHYRAWKESNGLVSSKVEELTTMANDYQEPDQPKIDFSDLPDLPF